MAETTARASVRGLFTGPGGAVRALGVLCLLVALVRGPVDTALFALVLAGLVVPVLAGVPRRLDAAYGIGLVLAAWCGALQLYQAVWWLDIVAHVVVPGLAAAVAHLLLARRTGAVVDPSGVVDRAERIGAVVVTASLGFALAVLWEVGEYLGHTYVDPEIFVAYVDTVGDLVAGGLGSVVAGVWLTRRRREPGGSGTGGSTAAAVVDADERQAAPAGW